MNGFQTFNFRAGEAAEEVRLPQARSRVQSQARLRAEEAEFPRGQQAAQPQREAEEVRL